MTNNFFCNYFIQKTTPVYLNFCWELLNSLDLKKGIAPHNIRNASIMYRLCFQIADIQFDVAASNTSLKETHKKPLFQMPRFRFIRNNEQCQLLPPSTSFVTLWAIKPACSKFSSALEILTAQLTAVASSLPFLSSAMVLLQGACQRTMWELQALMHFEEREKGWLLFLCADSQVGSQTSILQTFKAALKAVHDQAITLTNSAFSP